MGGKSTLSSKNCSHRYAVVALYRFYIHFPVTISLFVFHLYQRFGPQVDGLGMSGRGGEDDDPGAGDRHARRLHMRRERAVHAAEEESYG